MVAKDKRSISPLASPSLRPPADVPSVNLSELVVDPEFEGPIGFVLAKLQSMGESSFVFNSQVHLD